VRGQSSSETRNFYHDEDGTLLTDIDTTSNAVTHYIHTGSRLVAAGSAGKGYVFHHFDKTGNTLALTDTTGQVVGAFAYDAYGKVVARSGAVSTPFTYVGAYGVIEGTENLFFMRNRYYDAITGRFIQRDPIGFAGGQSNLYGYLGNEPVLNVDPEGLLDLPSYQSNQGVLNKASVKKLRDQIFESMSKNGGFSGVLGEFSWLGQNGFIRNWNGGACMGAAQNRNKSVVTDLKSNPEILGSYTVELGTTSVPGHTWNVFIIKDPAGTIQYQGSYDDYLKQSYGRSLKDIKWMYPNDFKGIGDLFDQEISNAH
jgi:RHS repeat-associated protein